MRNFGVGLLSLLMGGAAAYYISLYSSELGFTLVLKGVLGGGASVWLVLGLLTLWHNNILIGAVLDRWFLFFMISTLLGAGFIYAMVYQVHNPMVRWAWLALPLLAGALYRLWLVLDFARHSLEEQVQVGRQIDDRLLRAQQPGTRQEEQPTLFDPFNLRENVQDQPTDTEGEEQEDDQEEDINLWQQLGQLLQKE